jgi:nucleoid DNA-binding protein
MNRRELVDTIASETGVPVKRVQNVLDAIFRHTRKALDSGDHVVLRAIGSFRPRRSISGDKTVIVFTPAKPPESK